MPITTEARWILIIYDKDRYKVIRTNYPSGEIKKYPYGFVLLVYYIMDGYYAQVVEARIKLMSRKQKISLINNGWVKTKCSPRQYFYGITNLIDCDINLVPDIARDFIRRLRATKEVDNEA